LIPFRRRGGMRPLPSFSPPPFQNRPFPEEALQESAEDYSWHVTPFLVEVFYLCPQVRKTCATATRGVLSEVESLLPDAKGVAIANTHRLLFKYSSPPGSQLECHSTPVGIFFSLLPAPEPSPKKVPQYPSPPP